MIKATGAREGKWARGKSNGEESKKFRHWPVPEKGHVPSWESEEVGTLEFPRCSFPLPKDAPINLDVISRKEVSS